jgi:hypothetical protein
LPVPRIETALGEDGQASDPGMDKRFARFAAELEWYAAALKAGRERGVPY